MQCNDDKDTEGGKDGGEKKPGKAAAANEVTDEGGATTNYDEEASTTATTLIVPTKTEDGGRNEQGNQSSYNRGQGETATSNRPDLFRTYSDNNVRMMALLGVEPSANPNDGEQQEDWRQLTGFTGIGEERRRNNDGGDGNTTQRRTRLSAELHNSAFENMWIQQGLLDEPLQGQPPRQQQEEEEEDDGNSNSDSEENQQEEGC